MSNDQILEIYFQWLELVDFVEKIVHNDEKRATTGDKQKLM